MAPKPKPVVENKEEPHRMTKETVYYYGEGSEDYDFYGIYKKIYREYNYKYHGFMPWDSIIDDMHEMRYNINGYGDTIYMEYIDKTNFPRRED